MATQHTGMPDGGNLRLFLALWPTDAARDAVAAWQSQWHWPPRASVVPPERLHVTLHFLGDVPAARLRELTQVLDVPMVRADLRFEHAEMWQHGMAVLRPAQSPTALRALHARLGLALASIGLPVEERAWRPHVTLARRAFGARAPASQPDIAWRAHEGFVLVRTLPGGRGYEVLERFGA